MTAYLFEGWPAPDVKKKDITAVNQTGDAIPQFDPFSLFSESKPNNPPAEQKTTNPPPAESKPSNPPPAS